MNDDSDGQDSPSSGSRWEPAAAGSDAPGAACVPPQPAATADVPAYPVAPTRGGRLRRRATLAGTGAVLLVAGGVGGVALGHEAASTGADETSVVQGTNPGPSDPDGDGFREHPGFRDRGTPPGSDGDGTPGGNGSTGGSGGDTSTGDGTT